MAPAPDSEEYLCLRLQGAAEKKWLCLRGFKGGHREALIARCKATCAETLVSYNWMLRNVTNKIDKLRMQVCKYENYFAQSEKCPVTLNTDCPK
ncbi:hypothetical protein AAF712_016269 [Marasmius tenuissimus]|uniref:Uncharacterized protein n=1 Tax=Marasmius tenuissimus TaxID=585030 RepID=A0ABR2Z6B7_9AGAR